jgi:hypothetical protein
MVWLSAFRPRAAGWNQIIHRAHNPIRNTHAQKTFVIGVRIALKHRRACRSGMGMRGGDQHPVRRQAGPAIYVLLGGFNHVPRDHAAVAYDDGKPDVTIVQHQAPGVQFVMDMACFPIRKMAVNRHSQRWGDNTASRPGLELPPDAQLGRFAMARRNEDEQDAAAKQQRCETSPPRPLTCLNNRLRHDCYSNLSPANVKAYLELASWPARTRQAHDTGTMTTEAEHGWLKSTKLLVFQHPRGPESHADDAPPNW